MSTRQYVWYCLAVSILLVSCKLILGADVAATSLFADDHEYLNRSPYMLRGDLRLTGYPFSKTAYGPLYPLVVSPWILATDPGIRVHVVFAINAVLSAVVVMFGSLTVSRLTRTAALLVPLCLAAFPPLFLFSFYAMSENLLFALLAIGGWLVVDFDQTCRRPLRALALLLIVVMLPLVRVPGLAVLPALAALAWQHRHGPFRSFPVRIAAVVAVALPCVAYGGVYLLGMESDREDLYLATLRSLASDPSLWRFPVELALSQIGYVFFTTGAWVLPIVLALWWQVRDHPRDADRQRWLNYLTYAGTAGAGFVLFAVMHLVQKLDPGEGTFIYGRYNDPATVLLLVGGLAAVQGIRPQGVLLHLLLRLVTPLALCLVLAKVTTKFWLPPANQSGLAIFAGNFWPFSYYAAAVALLVAVQLLSDRPRWYAPAAMLFLLTYSVLTCRWGVSVIEARARRALPAVESARWIAQNLPPDARIGYDATLLDAPALRGHKTMRSVYRSMAFRVHPRMAILVDREADLARVDYFFTRAAAWRTKTGLVLWRRVYRPLWSNQEYALYRISHEGRAARGMVAP